MFWCCIVRYYDVDWLMCMLLLVRFCVMSVGVIVNLVGMLCVV